MTKHEFLGLRTVIYKVGDIAKATQWYTRILGKEPYFDQPFYVGFNVAGYELGLQPKEGKTKNNVQTAIVYWGVRDIKQSYQRLLELGAAAHESPENVGGNIMVATVKDPWHNEFGIIYNPEFGAES